MEKAKEITPAEEIMVTTEEIVAEAKEEAKEAPSRLRQKLHELQATRERASIQFFQAPTKRIWASDLSEAIARERRRPHHQD